ncbi:MAG: hypothetical protein ABJ310_09815 [Roseobacter sp.]
MASLSNLYQFTFRFRSVPQSSGVRVMADPWEDRVWLSSDGYYDFISDYETEGARLPFG